MEALYIICPLSGLNPALIQMIIHVCEWRCQIFYQHHFLPDWKGKTFICLHNELRSVILFSTFLTAFTERGSVKGRDNFWHCFSRPSFFFYPKVMHCYFICKCHSNGVSVKWENKIKHTFTNEQLEYNAVAPKMLWTRVM